MRVLFFINHDGFIRNFESLLHALVDRGDTVQLAVITRRAALMSEAGSLEELAATTPSITLARIPKQRDRHARLLRLLSASRSYLRFLGPEYADAPKLRARAGEYIPAAVRRFLTLPVVRSRFGRGLLDKVLLALIESSPTSAVLDDFTRRSEPDVVLLTPLISLPDVVQQQALRSARAAGIPTALLVHSWDNLTNKGLIHTKPDRVAVWNEAQKREAVELHGIPEERVVVTGAQSYDHWFAWQPSTTREEFCRKVGLDPARPFILYTCSSTFIAPEEVPFIQRWLTALRTSTYEEVRSVGVVIRPHPQHTEQWAGVGPGELDGAVVYPPISADRAGVQSRSDYFDSIHHCRAVVGVNTTALIESAIQERPVLTWLAPEFRDTQRGTLHFNHLAADDGLLLVGETFEEHEAQLAQVLSAGSDGDERSRRFVKRFVRPHGVDVEATPQLVDAVVRLAAADPEPISVRRRVATIAVTPLRWLLLALVALIGSDGRSKQKVAAKPPKAAKQPKAKEPKAKQPKAKQPKAKRPKPPPIGVGGADSRPARQPERDASRRS